MNEKTWHIQDAQSIIEYFQSDGSNGLTGVEAANRLQKHGYNEIIESGTRSPWRILWEQVSAVMVLILLGAALLSALLGEFKDAAAIGSIVVLFALLGFIQEYRAERAMAALKQLAAPKVRAVRDGQVQEITSRELTPGDIILLEAGNLVPADCRLLETVNLRIQEATLTGESEPVEKIIQPLASTKLPLGDRINLAYMGTVVTYGRGKALVVETGMYTELGRIASMLQNVSHELTPLQQRLDQLGKILAVIGFIVSAIIFAVGLAIGEAVRDMLLTSVSIAVAIVPEGLPAVVTITLALGAQRMLKRQALIRKLPAVETLGSVTVICSDKTGTLTENRMSVVILDVAGQKVQLSETMLNRMPVLETAVISPDESNQDETKKLDLSRHPDSIGLLLAGGALCNDAILNQMGGGRRWHAIGDPTEAALVVAAAKFELAKDLLETSWPRVMELPFDSERKRMTTVHKLDSMVSIKGLPVSIFQNNAYIAFTKGAVDGLLDISTSVYNAGQIEALDERWRARVQRANDDLAQQGMRVLGVAFRQLTNLPLKEEQANLEQGLTLIGLVGLIDPPRPEVANAVQTCRQAGIRPVMITGDHPLTAREIARQLGIVQNGQERVLTGRELEGMTSDELSAWVDQVSVYARVSPEHKLKIVNALQNKGQIVAMTGDGVNDAPALKKANIGVAMGITGTDVSKEASDMVLQDDNFATIVAAVEEGRTIYDNLRKFIKFSVAGNIGKVSVMLLAPLLGKPLPLEPLQLLWLNLLTDGLLGLGLGLEPPEKDVMRRPPVSPRQGIFSGGLGKHVLWVGALIGTIALGIGYVYWLNDPNGNWQTMVFSTLAFSQWIQAFATRSRRESFLRMGFRSNKTGMSLAGIVFLLQLAVIYLPWLQDFFHTESLSLIDLAISLGLSSLVFFTIEIEKWFIRRAE